uniref:Uncharacterized protein n=1 Tax=Macrostomum lignano TaxID=282301 RepID=A0A1I8HXL9_9PLAT
MKHRSRPLPAAPACENWTGGVEQRSRHWSRPTLVEAAGPSNQRRTPRRSGRMARADARMAAAGPPRHVSLRLRSAAAETRSATRCPPATCAKPS